jgi:tetratricopeptide (TPR) repeat protein
LAGSTYKLGNYEVAKNYIEKAVEKESDNATLVDHLADVYYKLGDKEKAMELWQKALELDSSLDTVKQKIAKEGL